MNDRLKRLLPDPESVRNNRWLRWIGPALHNPRLWRPTRRGMALGIALGVFFGLLVPVAQIPLSAGTAVLLRANVPTAIASTLITNPLTFGPIYYMAHKIGATLVGDGEAHTAKNVPKPSGDGTATWLTSTWDRVTVVGKPLLLGLAIMASAMGLLAYLIVTWLWRLKTGLAWRRRRRKSAPLREETRQDD
ncbi:MAG: DUF2062 domain-containing protein [Methylophilaceae bacterium]